MESITVRTKPEEIESIYLEAHETCHEIEELNNTLDAIEPLLNELTDTIDKHKIKAARVRKKLSTIAAKL